MLDDLIFIFIFLFMFPCINYVEKSNFMYEKLGFKIYLENRSLKSEFIGLLMILLLILLLIVLYIFNPFFLRQMIILLIYTIIGFFIKSTDLNKKIQNPINNKLDENTYYIQLTTIFIFVTFVQIEGSYNILIDYSDIFIRNIVSLYLLIYNFIIITLCFNPKLLIKQLSKFTHHNIEKDKNIDKDKNYRKIKLIVVGLNIIPLTLTFLIIYFI